MRCEVQHNFAAARDGKRFAWKKGDVVEVDADDVEWANVDSPGVLKAVGESKAAKKAAPPTKPAGESK